MVIHRRCSTILEANGSDALPLPSPRKRRMPLCLLMTQVEVSAAFGPLARDVAACSWVAGHAYQRNAAKRAVGCAVSATRKSVAGGSPEDAGTGAAPHSAANADSLRSRSGAGAGGDEQLRGDVGTDVRCLVS